jgi:predicted nucleic acid-binding protein
MFKKIADNGVLIAGLDARDPYHGWAMSIFEREEPPWLVCEPVLHEVSVNIRSPEPLLEMLKVGDLTIAFQLNENIAEVLALIKKYRDQEMDLADACVVRMSELLEDSRVYTVDRTDFSVYRRHSRRPIPCVFPE